MLKQGVDVWNQEYFIPDYSKRKDHDAYKKQSTGFYMIYKQVRLSAKKSHYTNNINERDDSWI